MPASCCAVLNTSHSVIGIFFGGVAKHKASSFSFKHLCQFILVCCGQRTGWPLLSPEDMGFFAVLRGHGVLCCPQRTGHSSLSPENTGFFAVPRGHAVLHCPQRTGWVLLCPCSSGPAARSRVLAGKGPVPSPLQNLCTASLKLISRGSSCLRFPSHLKSASKLSRNPSLRQAPVSS